MYPQAKKIRQVMDNFKTHDASALYETFLPDEAKRLRDRFEFVYTPKHGSWLNMAEIELHVLNGHELIYANTLPMLKVFIYFKIDRAG